MKNVIFSIDIEVLSEMTQKIGNREAINDCKEGVN